MQAQGRAPTSKMQQNLFLYFLPTVMTLVLSHQPGIVQFTILLNAAFSAVQQTLFRNTSFREKMNMTPPVKPAAELQNSGGFWAQVKERADTQQKSAMKKRFNELQKQKDAVQNDKLQSRVTLAEDYERRQRQKRQQKKQSKMTGIKEDKF
jgi:hypothetical protein